MPFGRTLDNPNFGQTALQSGFDINALLQRPDIKNLVQLNPDGSPKKDAQGRIMLKAPIRIALHDSDGLPSSPAQMQGKPAADWLRSIQSQIAAPYRGSYNYLVTRDPNGEVLELRGAGMDPVAQMANNGGTIAICLLGNKSIGYPPGELDQTIRAVETIYGTLAQNFFPPPQVMGHSDFPVNGRIHTDCPGFQVSALLNLTPDKRLPQLHTTDEQRAAQIQAAMQTMGHTDAERYGPYVGSPQSRADAFKDHQYSQPTSNTPSSTRYTPGAAGLSLIMEFEGCNNRAIHESCDPAGIYTVGYGHTNHADSSRFSFRAGETLDQISQRYPVRQPDGTMKVLPGREFAKYMLSIDLMAYGNEIVRRFPGFLNLPQNIQDAVVSYAYNCGTGRVTGSSRIMNALQSGDSNAIATALRNGIRTARGKVLSGLVRRREAEAIFAATGMATDGRGSALGSVGDTIQQVMDFGADFISNPLQTLRRAFNGNSSGSYRSRRRVSRPRDSNEEESPRQITSAHPHPPVSYSANTPPRKSVSESSSRNNNPLPVSSRTQTGTQPSADSNSTHRMVASGLAAVGGTLIQQAGRVFQTVTRRGAAHGIRQLVGGIGNFFSGNLLAMGHRSQPSRRRRASEDDKRKPEPKKIVDVPHGFVGPPPLGVQFREQQPRPTQRATPSPSHRPAQEPTRPQGQTPTRSASPRAQNRGTAQRSTQTRGRNVQHNSSSPGSRPTPRGRVATSQPPHRNPTTPPTTPHIGMADYSGKHGGSNRPR